MTLLLLLVLISYQLLQGLQDKTYRAHCETTKGPLEITVHPSWAPIGAWHFLELVQDEFYTDIGFFRCVKRFLTQFGISADPQKKHWHHQNLQDDPSLNLGIKKGYLSYAGGGPNTRSTQLFIAFEDLDFLGKEPWETPFGTVSGAALSKLYTGYGDIPPFGTGPDQQEIHTQGNAYLHEMFPQLDYLQSCHIHPDDMQAYLADKWHEGDDAPAAGSPEYREELHEQEQEELEEEEQEEESQQLEEQEQMLMGDEKEEMIKHYSLKHQRVQEHNRLLRQSLNTPEVHSALIQRAVFVLVSGLVVMLLWVKFVGTGVSHKKA